MSKRVKLLDWAARHFDPVPSLWTLRRLVRDGKIEPKPVKVGKCYYVQEDARPIDHSQQQTLLDRVRARKAA